MTPAPIYLDCNATTPVDPRVLEAMLPYLAAHYGNPSSDHVYGQRAKAAIEVARAEVAELIGATPPEIVFTGCATEANNLALLGAARAAQPGGRTVLVTSAIEHPSVLNPLRHLARQGWSLTELPVDAAGRVQVNHAANAITPEVALVSVMLANNETGSLQAVRALADLAHAAGALMHVDAAQAVGKVAVDVHALGADLLTLAGHKFYAPKGVGALVVRTGVALEPIQYGAGHEHGLRPGTENVPYIVALGEAARLARTTLAQEAARMTALRDRLHGLLAAVIPGLRLNGHPTERLPNTLNISFPAVAGWQVLAAAPAVAASTGSACHAGDHAASGVLAAMGLAPEAAAGAVRLSLGRFTTETEIDRAAEALIGVWKSLTA
ncbi:cysteine desulfurase family protein [Thiobacillus denitrificans]|uniref:cysteine desulfurase n=1 Tax=Thiobacillus denitrificans TaxID=36861 RepID=A0A119CTB3_THIDE|nr:cysteine desulfurase family protein [Thiobacillus denitrificans]KVW91322.1 cysteine desulfurase [Thiobacillus denitrificans]